MSGSWSGASPEPLSLLSKQQIFQLIFGMEALVLQSVGPQQRWAILISLKEGGNGQKRGILSPPTPNKCAEGAPNTPVVLSASPSSLGNTLCYLQALIDSSSLIKQKQQDSFLLIGQATIIFQKWILPAFTEDKHSNTPILISDFEPELLSHSYFFFLNNTVKLLGGIKRARNLYYSS